MCSCNDCAVKHDAKIPEGHMPTWWVDACDICGERKEVTALRDFGVDRFKLLRAMNARLEKEGI